MSHTTLRIAPYRAVPISLWHQATAISAAHTVNVTATANTLYNVAVTGHIGLIVNPGAVRRALGAEEVSPTRDVAKALLAVADEHGLVLKQPPPEVRFEKFCEKSLAFALHYWFDLKHASRDSLASDLRFMIEKALAEANIRIAG